VCLAVGSTFKCIRLREEPRKMPLLFEMLGATGGAISGGQFVPTDEKVYRNGALAEAKIFLAGLAFEKLLRPNRTYFEIATSTCDADFRGADEWCRYHVTGRPRRTEKKLSRDERLEVSRTYNRALRETRRLVSERWDDVVRVGDALAQRRELTQAEVEQIISPN